ncbi:MAG: YggU family protein [Alphaproteobacteria bacterium]|nr:YggU family protein [Alphaproteobacteria bacterium]MBO4643961.1 YggU family protein [Alphaproteobacteria bacterium]
MFYQKTSDGLKVFVRLSPKAKREGLEGIHTDPDGTERLKIAVSAPPVDGKANEALIKWLSKYLHIAKSAVTLISGLTDRSKTVMIVGDSDELIKKLELSK